MNNCIEKMRECYKFDDDKTEIILADLRSNKSNCVTVCTTLQGDADKLFAMVQDKANNYTNMTGQAAFPY